MSDKKTILKQLGKAVLVRIDSEVVVGDKTYKGVEYEIWSDIDKMIANLRTNEDGTSNVKPISSLNDSEPIELFESIYGKQE